MSTALREDRRCTQESRERKSSSDVSCGALARSAGAHFSKSARSPLAFDHSLRRMTSASGVGLAGVPHQSQREPVPTIRLDIVIP